MSVEIFTLDFHTMETRFRLGRFRVIARMSCPSPGTQADTFSMIYLVNEIRLYFNYFAYEAHPESQVEANEVIRKLIDWLNNQSIKNVKFSVIERYDG